MSPIAHIGFTYILVKLAQMFFKIDLSGNEVLFVVLIANAVDFDYLVGRVFGKKGESHHSFFTHTPLGILTTWAVISVILYVSPITFNTAVYGLLLLGMFFHLILDEAQYWFYKMGLQKFQHQQINWFYPFTLPSEKNIKTGDMEKFFGTMKMNLVAEAGIIMLFVTLLLI